MTSQIFTLFFRVLSRFLSAHLTSLQVKKYPIHDETTIKPPITKTLVPAEIPTPIKCRMIHITENVEKIMIENVEKIIIENLEKIMIENVKRL